MHADSLRGPVFRAGTYGVHLKGTLLEGQLSPNDASALRKAGIISRDKSPTGTHIFSEDACFEVNHMRQPRRGLKASLYVSRTAPVLAALGAMTVIAAPLLASAAAMVSLPMAVTGLVVSGFGVLQSILASRDISRIEALDRIQEVQGKALHEYHEHRMERIRSQMKSITLNDLNLGTEKSRKAGKGAAEAKAFYDNIEDLAKSCQESQNTMKK